MKTTKQNNFRNTPNINHMALLLTGSESTCIIRMVLTISRTLKDFEELLPAYIFIRIHNSTIVNKFFVDKYIRGDGGQVVMRNGNIPDVSKRKKSDFLQVIGY